MPVGMQINTGTRQIKELESLLSGWPKRLDRARRDATNRTLTSGVSMLAKNAAKQIPLKQKEIKPIIQPRPRRVRSGNTPAKINVGDTPITLKRFKAKQLKRGTKVTKFKGEGRQLIPRAFVAGNITQRLRGGQIKIMEGAARLSGKGRGMRGHVFRRKPGRDRTPIEKLYGPSILDALEREEGSVEKVVDSLGEVYQKHLAGRVEFHLLKAAGRL